MSADGTITSFSRYVCTYFWTPRSDGKEEVRAGGTLLKGMMGKAAEGGPAPLMVLHVVIFVVSYFPSQQSGSQTHMSPST